MADPGALLREVFPSPRLHKAQRTMLPTTGAASELVAEPEPARTGSVPWADGIFTRPGLGAFGLGILGGGEVSGAAHA
ncbi:hypothetical protein BJX68DRAFT_270070 [Aspergillus pseudodeflectus]|uniref:Uncharacterized protein n=1 Tax=Aspergillus pseudodeflectus TaxID=176178 RepID=A0ABR4JU59_9EURO